MHRWVFCLLHAVEIGEIMRDHDPSPVSNLSHQVHLRIDILLAASVEFYVFTRNIGDYGTCELDIGESGSGFRESMARRFEHYPFQSMLSACCKERVEHRCLGCTLPVWATSQTRSVVCRDGREQSTPDRSGVQDMMEKCAGCRFSIGTGNADYVLRQSRGKVTAEQ